MLTHEHVTQSAAYLREKLPFTPEIGIVLGSGLGPLAEEIEQPVCIPYGDIPFFRVSTAPDHAGRLVCGTLSGRRVVCMQGRLHGYEGYAPDEIAYPVYVLRELGVQALIVTNASGGINTGFEVGDFMLIDDHINLTGKSPLTGANDAALGTRFPDMSFAYAPALREKALAAAEKKIAERAKKNKVGNCGCVTPAEAEDILREFFGLPERGTAAAPQTERRKVVDLADFL